MTRIMIRHPYIRYRHERFVSMSSTLCIVGIGLRSETKKPVLTAVHPAYACEATTAKERGRSLVAELEPWKRGPVGVPTIHKVQRHRRGDVA